MSEWREVTLGDVLMLQRGFDITKKMQHPGTIPVISSSGVGSFHDEARAEGPAVVIGRKGSLGTVVFGCSGRFVVGSRVIAVAG